MKRLNKFMNWLMPVKRIEVNLLEFEEGDLLLISLNRNTTDETIRQCGEILDHTDLSNIDSFIMPSIENATIIKSNGCRINAIKVVRK